TLAEFVDKLATLPLEFSPGEHFNYSVATDVVGYLVELMSGEPLDEYFRKRIFEPLGMNDTGFTVKPSDIDRFAANYTRSRDKPLVLIDDPRTSPYTTQTSYLSGGAGLVSTAGDYLRFAEMLRRGGELEGVRLIGPRTLRFMTRNHLAGGQDLAACAVGSFSE